MLTPVLMVIGAYLIGSVSSAIIICRLMGLPDPRSSGSNNPGATNVLRIGGKRAAALTLLGDLLKGVLPVVLAHALDLELRWVAAVGLAAFFGHLYPLFFGFKGGKGVATAVGVLLALHWMIGAIFVGIWLVMARLVNISSLSALTATLAMPAVAWWLTDDSCTTLLLGIMALFIFWRHRSNIRNLLAGEEGKIKDEQGPEVPPD